MQGALPQSVEIDTCRGEEGSRGEWGEEKRGSN